MFLPVQDVRGYGDRCCLAHYLWGGKCAVTLHGGTELPTAPGDLSLTVTSWAVNAGINLVYTTAGGKLADDFDRTGNAPIMLSMIFEVPVPDSCF